ncbi:MAG: SDR family oxidoreductase [Alphaproteobacteria bacterium]|nr:SDR family oxidoreductase [Alphaproteobacteria bacterium]
MTQFPEFNGKGVIVTGASQGIGRASALMFAENGARVAVAARSREGCEETCHLIEQAGGTAIAVPTDMRDAAAIEALVKTAEHQFGRLDYAHNNAGRTMDPQSFVDLSEELWDDMMDTNLKGMWRVMKHQVPAMLRQGGGAIVDTSSIAAFGATPMYGVYGVSKAGLNVLVQTMAKELAEQNIRINAVAPGVIDTPMADAMGRDNADMVAQMTPMKRYGQPEEIAAMALWLCSDQTKFVTGQVVAVDGGLSA